MTFTQEPTPDAMAFEAATLPRTRHEARRGDGWRIAFLADRWAEYRYPDTIAAHLAGHALLQAGLLLLVDRFSSGARPASAVLALALVLGALWIHWLPALMMGGFHAAVLAAGQLVRAASAPHALWPAALSASIAILGGMVLFVARHVYQDRLDQIAGPPRGGRFLTALGQAWTGVALHVFFLLLRRGLAPALRQELTERSVLRFASEQGRPWRNWARNQEWHASRVWFPRTAADLVEIVHRARAEGRRIRVVGTAYSWEALPATADFLVCQCLMRDVRLDLSDPAHPLAIVEPGANGREVNRALEQHGYALPTNVVMETVSWGGMVSVGAHGSGWNQDTLSDLVEAIDLVDGQGRLRRFERGVDADEVLDAVRLSLGLFGIIYRITLRVEPAFDVRMRDELVPLDDVIAGLHENVPAHDYYDIYAFPFSDKAWIRAWDRTTSPRTRRPFRGLAAAPSNRTQLGTWSGSLQMPMLGILEFFMARLPRWAPVLCKLKTPRIKAGEWVCHIHEASHFRSGIELHRVGCAEVAFEVDPAFDHVRRAFRLLEERRREWAKAGKFPVTMAINARFVKTSRCLLSPAHGNERTCYIEILGDPDSPDWQPFVDEVVTAWMTLPKGRVHWGKEYARVPGIEDMIHESLGADLARFLRIRDELAVDPEGLFVNPFLGRLLRLPAP